MLKEFYNRFILDSPKLVLSILCVIMLILGYQAMNIRVDASGETLLLEGDPDLKLTREVDARYAKLSFLFITFRPLEGGLLTEENLAVLGALKADIEKLERITSVTSILDVPLLESPPISVRDLLVSVPTLEKGGIDKKLAKAEFLKSPIYKESLVSKDFTTTALQLDLEKDTQFYVLVQRRYELRTKQADFSIQAEEIQELAKLNRELKKHRDVMRDKEHQTVLELREVISRYTGNAEIYLGGVDVITDDLTTYVKKDLLTFGLGVLAFLIVTLGVIFRQVRWVFIPILSCAFSVIATSGFLGFFQWEVTIISSNFVSLQLIITMALSIHLTVRYRELAGQQPDWSQRKLVMESVLSMSIPCLYAVLTTVAGFGSLIFSGILPVINFGWMMATGVGVSLIITFLVFPTVVMLTQRIEPDLSFEKQFRFTQFLANITNKYGNLILGVALVVSIASGFGAMRLKVENSFLDYFTKNTEIYKSMVVIDQKLGGTTPLDVLITFPEPTTAPDPDQNTEEEDDEGFDDFEEELSQGPKEAQYWFTDKKLRVIKEVHAYLDSLPETGKVMSFGTMLEIGKTLNDGEDLQSLDLALVIKEIPDKFKTIILDPYISIENNQVRFSIRIKDSIPGLRRNELLQNIQLALDEKFGLEKGQAQMTGLMVLYNNMLQSLFHSQITTLGAVLFVLLVMFLGLFNSLRIALIALLPNTLSVGVVLGVMGWVGIPLDMMTITIAAISVGIAVDNTIHYIHRFKAEFQTDFNYQATMFRCHSSIGYAMYYTSLTIIVGFSILMISNFIPSIYFGALTGLAMLIALMAALTLLPQLIIVVKPFGKER